MQEAAWRQQEGVGARDTGEAIGTQVSGLVTSQLQETFTMEGETGFQRGGWEAPWLCDKGDQMWGDREHPCPPPGIRASEEALSRKDVLATKGKRDLLPEQSSVSPWGPPLPYSQSSG